MQEHESDGARVRQLSRRDVVRKGAVLGALVWAAPSISTVSSTAFAADAGSDATTVASWSVTIAGSETSNQSQGGSVNVPDITLVNTSDAAGPDIVSFTMTIGDTDFNWDFARNGVASGSFSFTRQTPDGGNSGVRSNQIEYTFGGGFSPPGGSFAFEADVDPDTGSNLNVARDYRTVLFNNGAASNSVVTVVFSDGRTVSKEWPDPTATSLDSYTLTGSSS